MDIIQFNFYMEQIAQGVHGEIFCSVKEVESQR